MNTTRHKLTHYATSLTVALIVHSLAIIIVIQRSTHQPSRLPEAVMVIDLAIQAAKDEELSLPELFNTNKLIKPKPLQSKPMEKEPASTKEKPYEEQSRETSSHSAPEEKSDQPVTGISLSDTNKPMIQAAKLIKPKPLQPKPVEKEPASTKEKPYEEQSRETSSHSATEEKSYQQVTRPSLRQVSAKAYWENALLAHLQEYKKYPAGAQKLGREGLNRLRFVVDAEGNVMSYELVSRSGNAYLDHATLDLIRRAQPLPKPPAYMLRRGSIEVVVPFVYNIE